jgi:transcriptional regulator with XRE-family HTH domain
MSEFEFTEAQRNLAVANYESQEALLQAINAHYTQTAITIEEVATQLGIATEVAGQILEGAYDLTLSELRQVANTLGLHIEYTVTPALNWKTTSHPIAPKEFDEAIETALKLQDEQTQDPFPEDTRS